MQELSCAFRRLLETERGSVVEIAFRGRYPIGSDGNSHGSKMTAYTADVVKWERPATVLFNLTELRYEWGDAIGGIALPFLDRDTSSFTPACVVAKGKTARALQWLFEDRIIFGLAGFKLFTEAEQGLRFLKKQLGVQTA
jgi:hypothetical protein